MFVPGKEYSFMVAAVNNEFRGAPSEPSKPLEYVSNTVTEKVAGLRVVSTSNDSIEISFGSSPKQVHLTFSCLFITEFPIPSFVRFHHVLFWEFPCLAWAVASCRSGPQAGGTP